jgi:outer membrane immunogenic protein
LGQTALAEQANQPFNWTGFYAGLHIGYGWGDANTTRSPLLPVTVAPTVLDPSTSGVVGGLQAGYNYQTGPFVVGIEADFSGTAIEGSASAVNVLNGIAQPGASFNAHENINWYGTLRPRVGYVVWPNLLLYGTGGLAYGNVSYTARTVFLTGNETTSNFSQTNVGWAAGGGAEFALSKCWTVKAEYLHMDLGSQSAIASPAVPNPPVPFQYKWDTTANVVNVGFNYKF